MDADKIPEFEDFIQNFAPHCGAPRSVFVGQLSVALETYTKELLRGVQDGIAQEVQRQRSRDAGFPDRDPYF